MHGQNRKAKYTGKYTIGERRREEKTGKMAALRRHGMGVTGQKRFRQQENTKPSKLPAVENICEPTESRHYVHVDCPGREDDVEKKHLAWLAGSRRYESHAADECEAAHAARRAANAYAHPPVFPAVPAGGPWLGARTAATGVQHVQHEQHEHQHRQVPEQLHEWGFPEFCDKA